MFAGAFHHVAGVGALAAAAALAVAVGGACTCPDSANSFGCGDYPTSDLFSAVARGANVVPPATDTAPRALATFNAATLAYTYNVTAQPAGTVDSIAVYEIAPGEPLPALATAIFCAGAAACAATSGTATVVPPATIATIRTSMRGYGSQLVVFTTTAQKAVGGAMRGTLFVNP